MDYRSFVENFSEISCVLFPTFTILVADGNLSSIEKDYLIDNTCSRLGGENGIFNDFTEGEVADEFRKTWELYPKAGENLKEKCFISHECCAKLWQRSFFPGAVKGEQSLILEFLYDVANADRIIAPAEGQLLEQFTHLILFGNFLTEDKRASYNKANPNSPWLKK
jgi:hypothetical protein